MSGRVIDQAALFGLLRRKCAMQACCSSRSIVSPPTVRTQTVTNHKPQQFNRKQEEIMKTFLR